ncbi:MAG: hypothetical protein IPH01_10940 [Elusimicrobia bacterium]|nr:hypothetical protein [Elusimicrobiota bacterium]
MGAATAAPPTPSPRPCGTRSRRGGGDRRPIGFHQPGFPAPLWESLFPGLREGAAPPGVPLRPIGQGGEAKGAWPKGCGGSSKKANLKKFDAFLRSGRWDVIVNTHFLPADILAGLKKRGEVRVPQITVVTDFEAHRLWVNEPTDFYCVASPEARSTLRHVGVSPARVRVTGIPIAPVFALPFDKRDLRRNLGFPEGAPRFAIGGRVGGGAGGVGAPRSSQHPHPLSVVVVTGTNALVAERLRSVPNPSRHAVRVLGFTREMERWMGAADLVISKPGGLTSSECLARGVPMAIVHPIPGQESRNSDYLLEAGAAVKINDLSVLTHKLARLLFSPRASRILPITPGEPPVPGRLSSRRKGARAGPRTPSRRRP